MTSLVVGTACPTLQFVVEGITVKTTAATSFEGGTCLDIKAGTKVGAKGTRQADGSVLASRIQIKERELETVEGEGRVTSLVVGTACPTLQFVVEGMIVKATAATLYERGTCADIQPGVLVHVKATSQADGTVAALIRIQENKVEGEGRIASVMSGTVCPARTFVVDTITVTTDAATVFERGTCADLQPGVQVHVRGTRRANDTVLASLVRMQN